MPGVMESDTANVWRRHPVAAMSVRCSVLVVPFATACLVGIYVGWAIGGANTLGWIVARIAGAGAASTVVFLVIERLCRRLLPLSTLLRLSTVFPDRAPRRFSIALRSTSLRRLREWANHPEHENLNALAEQVVTLATSLNFHDRRTRGHSERTRALAELLIEEMKLNPTEANEVRWGAFLHDIGKLLVPAAVLNKPGKPTPAEWAVLKRHPDAGGNLVEPLRPFIGQGVEAVRYHHENYDGSGYPDGLQGEEIPVSARVVAVVDCFEVMTAVRSYQRPMTIEAARNELVAEAGAQFDPTVVRAFLNVSIGRLHWALGVAAWMAEIPFLAVVPRAAAQVSAGLGTGATISTNALTSVAAVSFGAVAVVAPVAAHAASTGSTPRPVAQVVSPGSQVAQAPKTANGGVAPADGGDSTPVQAGPGVPAAAEASRTGAAPGSVQPSSAPMGSPGSSPQAAVAGAVATSLGARPAGAAVAPGSATGNAGGNGVAGANSNAGGNGNGNGNGVAGANSNAGGNGNGVAGANGNAGGNGNGNGVAGVNSNAGGNGNGVAGANSNAGGNGQAKGHVDPGAIQPGQ